MCDDRTVGVQGLPQHVTYPVARLRFSPFLVVAATLSMFGQARDQKRARSVTSFVALWTCQRGTVDVSVTLSLL